MTMTSLLIPKGCVQLILPEPDLAYGYCRCLHLCVRVHVSVFQPWVFPRDDSLHVQAMITTFGPEVHNNLVKVPLVLVGNWPWPWNWSLKSKFTPFWLCPCDKSPAKTNTFRQKVQKMLVEILVVLGIDWCSSSWSKSFYLKVPIPWIPGLSTRENT